MHTPLLTAEIGPPPPSNLLNPFSVQFPKDERTWNRRLRCPVSKKKHHIAVSCKGRAAHESYRGGERETSSNNESNSQVQSMIDGPPHLKLSVVVVHVVVVVVV